MMYRMLCLASMTLVAMGCATELPAEDAGALQVAPAAAQAGLRVTQRDETRFAGEFRDAGDWVKFSGVRSSPTETVVEIAANGALITARTNWANPEDVVSDFEVLGAKLDPGALRAMQLLTQELVKLLPSHAEAAQGTPLLPQEAYVRTYMSMFAEAPTDLTGRNTYQAHSKRQFLRQDTDRQVDASMNCADCPEPPLGGDPGGTGTGSNPCRKDNDGVTLLTACCWNGVSKPLSYDTRTCVNVDTTAQCGMFSDVFACAGRCGIGCYNEPMYTQDCFDHDICVQRRGGSVGGDSPDCGDEFWEAADDFAAIGGSLIFFPALVTMLATCQ